MVKLKSFSNWMFENKGIDIYEADTIDANALSKFDKNSDLRQNKHPVDYEKSLSLIIKLAMDKYPNETDGFFSRLSSKDEEIRELYNKVRDIDDAKMPSVSTPSEDDQIVPPAADGGLEGGNQAFPQM